MKKPDRKEIEVEMEVAFKVKFSVLAGQRGSRDSMGVPEEPDCPAQLEDIELEFPSSFEDLSERVQEEIKEQCWDSIE